MKSTKCLSIRNAVCSLGAAVLLLNGSLLLAQSEEQASASSGDEVFFETVQVNLVNVDVIVTDKKGNAIKGLSADDFVLYEDKRPVKITNFYAVEDGEPVSGGLDVEELALDRTLNPGDLPRLNREQSLIPEDQRLHVVVYIDNFNIRPFNRNRTFRALRTFLNEQLSKGDRVMLVSYDRKLNVRRKFTSDPSLIAAALTELETVSGHAVHVDSERRELRRAIDEAEDISEVEWRVRQYAESTFNDQSFSLDAVREMVDSLAGLTGRKAVVYVSDGFPQTPGEDLALGLQQKFGQTTLLTESTSWNMGRRLQELAAQANAHRVSFYNIDAGGLRVGTAASVEVHAASSPGLSSFIDSSYWSNIQSPLLLLAEETGGRAIINTNDATAGLKRVASELRNYYSLGFNPVHSGDGRLYKIKVETKTKGHRVHYRKSYRDKSLRSRMEDGTRATIAFDVETNPLRVILERGAQKPQSDGNYLVDFVVKIPLGQLVMIPRDDFLHGSVRLYFTAQDHDGGESDVQEVPLAIKIPAADWDKAEGQYWGYDVQLMMRGGGHRLGIGVRDDIGAVSSFIKEDLTVGRGGT